jgi:hypothetical protein
MFSNFEFDYYLTEQEACPRVENNSSCAATQNTDTLDNQTNDLGIRGEFEASNTLGSFTYRVVEQRYIAKRRRSQSQFNLLNVILSRAKRRTRSSASIIN